VSTAGESAENAQKTGINDRAQFDYNDPDGGHHNDVVLLLRHAHYN
jgi:hypothetical protein